MPTYIATIKNNDGDKVAPRTFAEAVTLADGTNLEDKIATMPSTEEMNIKIDAKQDKLQHPGDGQSYAFTLNGSGKPAAIQIAANSALKDTIVKRNSAGNVVTGTPSSSTDAINLLYGKQHYVAFDTSITDSNRYVFSQYNGKQAMVKMAANPTPDSQQPLARRRASGNVGTGTPTLDDDAANKKYVDDKVSTIKLPDNIATEDDVQAVRTYVDEKFEEQANQINTLLDTILALQDELINGALAYELSSDGTYYTVTGIGTYKNSSPVIFDTYKGLPVKYIADYAFKDNLQLTSITIGKNIDIIGKEAFLGCSNLTDIYITREFGWKEIMDEETGMQVGEEHICYTQSYYKYGMGSAEFNGEWYDYEFSHDSNPKFVAYTLTNKFEIEDGQYISTDAWPWRTTGGY